MNDILTLATTLEDLLVQEFRACQSLHQLTREERQALSKNDLSSLEVILEQKEVVLDELGQIEDRRRMVTQNLGDQVGLKHTNPTLTAICQVLNNEIGRRIRHLKEGVSALAEEIKIMTSGNHALAMIALERVDALQTILIDSFRPSLTYERPGAKASTNFDMIWDVDQRA
ncbi:MAG: hypothetical protein ANABAC_2222 [Anaerolineae bacterium]|jgi:flagellar biosynthesis/type III secretory pathway chaperone|nr:MAG: hypothetical protein ANABAC_2222 [Anaerolineae bacterium]